MKALVAMSGGVDSAVAAALLVDAGHEVTGVHLKLADVPIEQQVPGHGCCTLDDAQDARRTAQVLGIPFYVWDMSELFARTVVDPFAAAYASGRTPNPCVECNRSVKYAALLDRALRLGFDALATGHHARVIEHNGRRRLLRGADVQKDQSYVLYVATQEQLARSLFPVGALTKAEVREEAARRGLRVASKPDSYDVCFIPDGDTASYLARRLPVLPGAVVGTDGARLGSHDGTWRFTVGQRRGLGLHSHERRYVADLDAAGGTVVVGPRTALRSDWVELRDLNWTAGVAPAGEVLAQVRAHGATTPATIEGDRVRFAVPVEALAPGQSCVLYAPDDDECLGGGVIDAADRSALATTIGRPTRR